MSLRSTIRHHHPLRILIVALSLAAIQLSASANARAHDPAKHGFSLVTFEPPFPAPEFALADLRGTKRTLASWRGGYVLLNFWATWCPPCLAEMPSMEKLQRKYPNRRLSVVAASSDEAGAASVQPFVDKLGISFPILLDADKKVASVYGAQDLPLTFLINPQGEVIAAAKGARDWASPQALEVLGELITK